MCKKLLLGCLLVPLWPAAVEASPSMPVSPGAEELFLGVGSTCPTFSWTAGTGAGGYELVVYSMPSAGDAGIDAVGPNLEAPPAIRATVPAGALSWTPPSTSCLDLDASYAWLVRSLDGDGVGGWSVPALFKVEMSPVVEQLGGALERALARYLGGEVVGIREPGALAALILDEISVQPSAPAAVAPAEEKMAMYLGQRVPISEVPMNDPVLSLDDWEIDAHETGTAAGDFAQIVLSTENVEPDWAFVVRGDNGTMFLSGPAFFDSIDFLTDGSTLITELEIINDLTVGGELEIVDLSAGTLSTDLCIDAAGGSKLGRCTSSIRFKEDVGDLELGLDAALKLRPVTFRWRSDDAAVDLGFIAEEVAAVDPLLATYDEEGVELGVKYRRMTALLTRAIQELASQVGEQRAEIERLRARLE